MPYIKQEDRLDYEELEIVLEEVGIDNPGALQYCIALLIKEYMLTHDMRYATCNDVLGALAGAQAEYYRRVVAPYEDQCIDRNGDIEGYGE